MKYVSLKKEFESVLTQIEILIEEEGTESAKKFIDTIRETKLGEKNKEV